MTIREKTLRFNPNAVVREVNIYSKKKNKVIYTGRISTIPGFLLNRNYESYSVMPSRQNTRWRDVIFWI